MLKWPRPLVVVFSLSLFGLCHVDSSVAQPSFPSRSLRIVTPFAAGAASDVMLRFLADKMSAHFKVPVVVENAPGAGGINAARAVTNAQPDGYNIAFVGNNTAIGVSLFTRPFDPRIEMVPVVGISDFAYLFVTGEKSPYQTMQDVIRAARSKPNSLNIGASSVGGSDHLIALLFKSTLQLDLTVVPFRGPSELSVALLRGDIDLLVNAYAGLRQAIAEKQMRPLATTAATRLPELPNVPTMEEGGVQNFVVTSWNGFYMNKGTPPAAAATIAQAVTEILSREDVRERFRSLGFEPRALNAMQFDQRMHSEIERWAKVISGAGIEKR